VGGLVKHVVGRTDDIEPGGRRVFNVKGRPVVIFNLAGEYFALLNRCPHQSAELSLGNTTSLVKSDEPGQAVCSRKGEFIRCPWHGWEFDIRTGQSWFDPDRVAVKKFQVHAERGSQLVQGPFKAETLPVSVDGNYLVVEA
jgi:3-phenylpropionate/trans-cinnamate dioxygenase ferredoxin subunit